MVIIVGLLFVVRLYSRRLYFFLFGTAWKTYDNCIAHGFHATILRSLLEAFYKAKVLEIRLTQHTRQCADCYQDVISILADDGIEITDVDTEHGKEFILGLFEQECFDSSTTYFFEYRTQVRPRRRRQRKALRDLVPAWLEPQPA
jgi:hypothetical protein